MALSVVREHTETGVERARELLSELLWRPESWFHELGPLTDGRCSTKLLALPDADAWLIRWAPGSVLDLHDHGPSSAALAVVEGRLVERHRSRGSTRLHRRVLARGEAVWFGPDHLHAVENRHPHTAASIHVYSPPLEQMTFPDHDGRVLTAADSGWNGRHLGTVGS
jgi:predicted metal-dependent enzyme (double-stranded beta helix superfamily)